MSAQQANFRVQKVVASVSVILFAIKVIAWWLTGSVAILTDALESTVNVVAGFISLYSLWVAAKPRDDDHPYGHGKAEFVAAAFEGSMIFVAGLIIMYESINNLVHPHALQKLDQGIYLVSLTAIINFAVGWYCVRVGKKNNSLALIASGKHLQSDTYTTGGIVLGLTLVLLTGWLWLDSAVAILFGGLLVFTGYKIIRSSLAGIMDEADKELLEKLVGRLNMERPENWVDLHNLRIIKYGSILHMDCHLTVPWYLNVNQAHAEIDELSRIVREEFGESMELFVHNDGCLDFSCRICSKAICAERKHAFEQRVEWTVENISRNTKHGLD